MNRWWRIAAAGFTLAAGLTLLAVVVWLSLSYQYRELENTVQAALEAQELDEAAIIAALAGPDPQRDLAAWNALKLPDRRRLTVIAPDGGVLYDSAADPGHMENHNSRPEVVQARATGSGVSRRISDTVGIAFIYAARALPDGRVVRVAAPFTIETALVRGIFSSMAAATLLVAASAAALVALNLWRNRYRFRELREVSRAFSRGEFSRRAIAGGRGTYASLGLELNQLGERLQETLHDLAASRELLDGALGALAEGVACVDRLDRVLYANPAWRQLAAGGGDVAGQLFYEHLPAAPLAAPLSLARAAATDGGSQTSAFEHRRRHLQAVVAPAGEVTVIILHDVTEVRRAEQARRDFMSGVSHEFKTPLTSIQGFTDTLLDGALDDRAVARDFVAKISKHAERLSVLVNDVLTLARLEQGSWEVRPETLDLAALGRAILDEFHAMADAKRVRLALDAPAAMPVVSDPELLRQLIGNLVSNAIRYNREGGSAILAIADADGQVRITVSDTGIGISAEHRERVFERFYRVDAHRSRQTGGTGLGLAIVKQLVDILAGSIRLLSDDRGTVFEVSIPRRLPGAAT